MFDLKVMRSALDQLEQDRGIPKEKVLEAIEMALAAAYKKDYGKKGQIVKAEFDLESGKTNFFQVKIAVDESIVKMEELEEGEEEIEVPEEGDGDTRARFNPEHHILLEDAKKIKKDVELEEEMIFPLEDKGDYGRIAAQTAKQVIIQRIREAEKTSVLSEYEDKEGDIVNGTIQRMERGNVFVDLGRVTGLLPYEEQIPGEYYKQGERIKAYLYSVEETPKGINLRLSRSHPKFIEKLFAIEAPEIANGIVEIKIVAREAGSRSKIAVLSSDEQVDPIGACVGQRGIRVSTIMNELGGEKIDIIEWSEDPIQFIADSLSPANIVSVEINEEEKRASVEVAEDQLSLAIGKGGQNVRLAAKLTGWKIDIEGLDGQKVSKTSETGTSEEAEVKDEKEKIVETPEVKNTETKNEEVKEETPVEEAKEEKKTEEKK